MKLDRQSLCLIRSCGEKMEFTRPGGLLRAALDCREHRRLIIVRNQISRFEESITYEVSTPLLVRSPPLLTTSAHQWHRDSSTLYGVNSAFRATLRLLCLASEIPEHVANSFLPVAT